MQCRNMCYGKLLIYVLANTIYVCISYSVLSARFIIQLFDAA